MNKEKLVIGIVSFLLAVFLVWAVLVVGGNFFNQINQRRDAREYRSTAPLSDQLVFPQGWTPVGCQTDGQTYNGCYWVCVKDSVYRYCTPEIQKVDSTLDGTR